MGHVHRWLRAAWPRWLSSAAPYLTGVRLTINGMVALGVSLVLRHATPDEGLLVNLFDIVGGVLVIVGVARIMVEYR